MTQFKTVMHNLLIEFLEKQNAVYKEAHLIPTLDMLIADLKEAVETEEKTK